jgi:hypothetical protein
VCQPCRRKEATIQAPQDDARQGIGGAHREPRQRDALDDVATCSAASGIRGGASSSAIDDEAHDGRRLMRQASTMPTPRTSSRPSIGRTGRATSARSGPDLDAVVADEAGEAAAQAPPRSELCARLDLPLPEAPRIRTPASPITTQVA